MKKTIIAFLAIFYSCQTKSPSQILENDLKDFLKKEYVPTMNDPKSYEFVSYKIDTINGEKYDLKQMIKILDSKISNDIAFKMQDSIKANPTKRDSIIGYEINVSLRGKNAMGALVIKDVKVDYSLSQKKFTLSNCSAQSSRSSPHQKTFSCTTTQKNILAQNFSFYDQTTCFIFLLRMGTSNVLFNPSKYGNKGKKIHERFCCQQVQRSIVL